MKILVALTPSLPIAGYLLSNSGYFVLVVVGCVRPCYASLVFLVLLFYGVFLLSNNKNIGEHRLLVSLVLF